MRARLCARPRGNESRSLNSAADLYQVEKTVAFPGASVARYLHRASFLEQKRGRLKDQPVLTVQQQENPVIFFQCSKGVCQDVVLVHALFHRYKRQGNDDRSSSRPSQTFGKKTPSCWQKSIEGHKRWCR